MPVVTANGRTLLFVHVPKTAGMSVARFMSDNGTVTAANRLTAYGQSPRLRHLHAEPLTELYAKGCFDWVFMIVRDPVQKMLSEYRYQRRKSGLHLPNLLSFPVWLRYSLARRRRDPSYRENHFRPQAEFRVFDAEVFRLEDGLDHLETRFCEVTGVANPIRMTRENPSPKRKIDVRPQDVALIRETFARDYQEFGYA